MLPAPVMLSGNDVLVLVLVRTTVLTIIVRPLSRITTMGGGCAHRSGRVMELRLECGDGIRVDAGFRKRVPLR